MAIAAINMWIEIGLPTMTLTNKIRSVMNPIVTLASCKLSDNACILFTIISTSHLRLIKTARTVDVAPTYASEPEYPIPQTNKIINCATKKATWCIITGNFLKIEAIYKYSRVKFGDGKFFNNFFEYFKHNG